MIKSFAAFARVHLTEDYNEYLKCKACGRPGGKRKRLKQVIKAEIMTGGKEYKYSDWVDDYEEYCKEYYWQGVEDAKTY